jgi:rhodanese-related sulfurtransferase/DNA-binding transcriptional ArsR family regulator
MAEELQERGENPQQAKAALFDGFARIGAALSSGRRVELLDILSNGERSVERLAELAGLSVANASRHLRVLLEAGLVRRRRAGLHGIYALAGDDVHRLIATTTAVARTHDAEIERLAARYLGSNGGVEPLTRAELQRRLQAGEKLTIIDVRPTEEYEAGHIPSARSIPLSELRDRLGEIPKRGEIVAYCRGQYCMFADAAVRLLSKEGRRARRLVEGLPEWRSDGLAVVAAGAGRSRHRTGKQ